MSGYPKIVDGVSIKLETREAIDNDDTGARMKAERVKAKLSLRKLASFIGVSHVYISDLEKGRRNWNRHKVSAYMEAIQTAIHQQGHQ